MQTRYRLCCRVGRGDHHLRVDEYVCRVDLQLQVGTEHLAGHAAQRPAKEDVRIADDQVVSHSGPRHREDLASNVLVPFLLRGLPSQVFVGRHAVGVGTALMGYLRLGYHSIAPRRYTSTRSIPPPFARAT